MAWTIKQKNVAEFASSAGARTLQFTTQNVTQGSSLFAWIGTFNPNITVTVSDDTNGSYTQQGSFQVSSDTNVRISLWSFFNSAGGVKPTVTVTPSAAAFMVISLLEEAPPANTTVKLDTVTSGATGTSASAITPSCTVSGAGELVLAFAAEGNQTSTTPAVAPASFTNENTTTGSTSLGTQAADDVNASASEAATFTWSSAASVWVAMAASFQAVAVASGGGGSIPAGGALPGAVPPRQLKHDHRLMGVFRTGMDERLARRLKRVPWERAHILG